MHGILSLLSGLVPDTAAVCLKRTDRKEELSAEGGSRTHTGKPHTILSRARLPVPPLRRDHSIIRRSPLVKYDDVCEIAYIAQTKECRAYGPAVTN
jgi:hypothetical protein